MVPGSINCNLPSPLPSSHNDWVSSLQGPLHPLPGPPLPQRSPPLRPTWSGLNTDTWQICSQNWKDSTLNLQERGLSYQHCKDQAATLKLSHFGKDEPWYTIALPPQRWRFCTHSNPLCSGSNHSGREPEGTLWCYCLEYTDKKHANFGGHL